MLLLISFTPCSTNNPSARYARPMYFSRQLDEPSIHSPALSLQRLSVHVSLRPHTPTHWHLTHVPLLLEILSSKRRQRDGTENQDHKPGQQLGKSDPLSLVLSLSDLKHLPVHSSTLGKASFFIGIYLNFSHARSFQRPDSTQFFDRWPSSILFGSANSATPMCLPIHHSRDTYHECFGVPLFAPHSHRVS